MHLIKAESGFPVKTLCINVIGAFVIGLVAALETNDLMVKGSNMTATLYMILSVVMAIAAVFTAQKIIG